MIVTIDGYDADKLRELVDKLALANGLAMQNGALLMWTITDHPRDYPDEYVARCHSIRKGETKATCSVIKGRDLEMLRSVMQLAGMVCLGRKPPDEPVIVETWV